MVTRILQVRAPRAILLLTAVLVVPKLWLFGPIIGDIPPSERITELLFHLLPIPFAAVGALIAARRPGHRIGWLLLVGSLAIASAQLTWSYVSNSLSSGVALPGPAVVGWIGNWIPWPALAAFALLLLLFPDGRLPSLRSHGYGHARDDRLHTGMRTRPCALDSNVEGGALPPGADGVQQTSLVR